MLHHTRLYRCLLVSGPDAQPFLQSQLTHDVAALGIGDWQWQGYCSAKGRLLSTFALLRRAETDFVAVVPSDTAELTTRRLAMFRMRSKVSFAAAPPHCEVLLSMDAVQAPGQADGQTHALPNLIAVTSAPNACVFRISAERSLVIAGPSVDYVAATEEYDSRWALAGINARIPEIHAATTDHFVPQMIGWDTLAPGGGVSFSKGCYPGQEIVARAHYRGAVKRQLYLQSFDHDVAVVEGAEVTLASGQTGDVCNAARQADGSWRALVVA